VEYRKKPEVAAIWRVIFPILGWLPRYQLRW
jgi:hypothetical protein